MTDHGLANRLTEYGDREFALFLRRSFAQSMGFSADALGKPIIGIVNTYSELNNCHRGFRELAEAVKRGVWQAGGLPAGTYTLRLRVVKADGNYAELFIPNLTVNQGAAEATPTSGLPTETPTPTATFTPAPQPTPALGQVTQPQVEGDELTPTPAPVAVVDPGQTPPADALLPTPTPGSLSARQTTSDATGSGLTRELGEALSFQRLRTQLFNGMRISAAIFIGIAAIVLGKRVFEWVWRRYS